jgi:hypothetical protein
MSRTRKSTRTKAERESIALSVYKILHQGYEDRTGKHMLKPDGAGERRYNELLIRLKVQKAYKDIT